MKKETITQYVAKDGTTFTENSHLECAWYELMLEGKENIKFWDDEQKPIKLDPTEAVDFLNTFFEAVCFINIETESMAIAFDEFLNEILEVHNESIGVFDYLAVQEGFYFYDGANCEWRHWQSEMESLKVMAETFQLFEFKEEEELPLSFEEVLGEEA